MQSSDDLYAQLLNWYRPKHSFNGDNTPLPTSKLMLAKLTGEILLPISKHFGELNITYGFTSPTLTRHIQRLSPAGTAPNIDQHACVELNSKGKNICKRPGAACDFLVQGFETRMQEVVQYICLNLQFDKLYFYSQNQPIHISVADNPLRHLQVMNQSENGRQYPGKKAFGDQAILLAKGL